MELHKTLISSFANINNGYAPIKIEYIKKRVSTSKITETGTLFMHSPHHQDSGVNYFLVKKNKAVLLRAKRLNSFH